MEPTGFEPASPGDNSGEITLTPTAPWRKTKSPSQMWGGFGCHLSELSHQSTFITPP